MSAATKLPGDVGLIHFVGIGGIGMSGIAEVLLNHGYLVQGSDLRRSPITARLQEIGATVFEGQRAENLGDAEVVVISTAIRPDNPEVVAARASGIPVVRRIGVKLHPAVCRLMVADDRTPPVRNGPTVRSEGHVEPDEGPTDIEFHVADSEKTGKLSGRGAHACDGEVGDRKQRGQACRRGRTELHIGREPAPQGYINLVFNGAEHDGTPEVQWFGNGLTNA